MYTNTFLRPSLGDRRRTAICGDALVLISVLVMHSVLVVLV